MKTCIMLVCVVSLGMSLCAGVSASAADEPAFTVDSPFDLTLGSTNYAVRLGKSVRSNTSAWYDPETKVTTTNWSAYGSVRLSAPYHGVKSVSLDFKGEERWLDSFRFDIGEKKHASGSTLTVEECRKVMKEIADDISNRFGVKMEADKSDGELSDEEIDERIEQMTKDDSGKRRTVYTSFSHIHGSGEREGVGVGYSISGMVGRKRMCSVSVSVYTLRRRMASGYPPRTRLRAVRSSQRCWARVFRRSATRARFSGWTRCRRSSASSAISPSTSHTPCRATRGAAKTTGSSVAAQSSSRSCSRR